MIAVLSYWLIIICFAGELGTVGGEGEDQDTAEIEGILNETVPVVIYASSGCTFKAFSLCTSGYYTGL